MRLNQVLLPKAVDCCGCGACRAVCSRGAISMALNEDGFLHPKVDKSKCIGCGCCESVCPVLHHGEMRKPMQVYAAKAKDDAIRWGSSSGGVFTLLAREVIARGGVVFGAGFESGTWRVIHKSARTFEELEDLRGSKYVQSEMGETFVAVKKCLADGQKVLFSGCPCQVAALRNFLAKDFTNLFLIDLICHGVPSPMAWDKFLRDEQVLHQRILTNVTGRKYCKWNDFGMMLGFSDGSVASFAGVFRQNPYMSAYLNRWMNRRSCHHCQFRQFKSGSDLTIGDEWSCYPVSNDCDRIFGISCVFSNTVKGSAAIKAIADNAVITTTDYDRVVRANLAVLKDDKLPKVREMFYGMIRKHGFLNAVNKLLPKRERPLLAHFAWWFKRLIVNRELNQF